ncbi:MAG: hypothetical protein RJA99_4350 [Pseudomonadota bacterium]|jgi:NADH dehydrogenase [ubiquinone] 1 alpha subcomplex assembly factor 1
MSGLTEVVFDRPEAVAGWLAIDDRVMGGVSSSRMRFDPAGHAVFEGMVSLDRGGGFASVRAAGLALGGPDTRGWRLESRGDGRRYRLALFVVDGFDAPSYQVEFEPPAGRWASIELPREAFEARLRGRAVPGAPPLEPARVRQLGLLVGDRQEGPFSLALRRIVRLDGPG